MSIPISESGQSQDRILHKILVASVGAGVLDRPFSAGIRRFRVVGDADPYKDLYILTTKAFLCDYPEEVVENIDKFTVSDRIVA